MKNNLIKILSNYLELFDELERQQDLLDFINSNKDLNLTDWNNFEGHIVSSAFIYALKEEKFLLLYHKDLKKYLYPGGHIDPNDKSILDASVRELLEETGISNFKQVILKDKQLPIDIDTHIIPFNERLNLPSHKHYDFRYLFTIDKITDIKQDTTELGDYKWVSIEELSKYKDFNNIINKIKKLIPRKTED